MKEFFLKLLSPQTPDDVGEVHLNWEYPQFVQRERSRTWYITAVCILVLLIAYAIYAGNFLFAAIIFLAVFIFVFQYFQKPRSIPVVITREGVMVDGDFFPYKSLASFSIVYEPPLAKFLYLDSKNNIRGNLSLPLEETNPMQVRSVLQKYLKESFERTGEDFENTMERFMRFR